LSSGLGTPLTALSRLRQTYAAALSEPALLDAWTVTKQVYVAHTDALARAEAEPHLRWYLDSFARSLRPDGLPGLTAATRAQAEAFAQRAAERRWEDLIEDSLLIGSPATIHRKVAELQAAGVGELACWMNFGGLPTAQVRRSMALLASEIMPEFQKSATQPHLGT
jgi:alkanesulfonate monooxygenase SsuD/methylene tetrahydromethanopterin reductase-like flavin-dependent oxidoreductase (luciferase family)